jgi:hypothetical protein
MYVSVLYVSVLYVGVLYVSALLTAAFYGTDLPYAPAVVPPVMERTLGLTVV